MGTVAPNTAGFHVVLCGALCCEPLGEFQGQNPKAPHYGKLCKCPEVANSGPPYTK